MNSEYVYDMENDILIGISTSGNSKNGYGAVKVAKTLEIKVNSIKISTEKSVLKFF